MSSSPTFPAPCVEIIEVENILSLNNSINRILLTKNIQRPCFRVRGKKLEVVKKAYKIKLTNKIIIKKLDNSAFKLKIKIPTVIGNYTISSIPNSNDLNLKGYLKVVSDERCLQIESMDSDSKIELNCGWITISLFFVIRGSSSMTLDCNMEYTLCFDKFDLTDNSVLCDKEDNSKITYDNDICLYAVQ